MRPPDRLGDAEARSIPSSSRPSGTADSTSRTPRSLRGLTRSRPLKGATPARVDVPHHRVTPVIRRGGRSDKPPGVRARQQAEARTETHTAEFDPFSPRASTRESGHAPHSARIVPNRPFYWAIADQRPRISDRTASRLGLERRGTTPDHPRRPPAGNASPDAVGPSLEARRTEPGTATGAAWAGLAPAWIVSDATPSRIVGLARSGSTGKEYPGMGMARPGIPGSLRIFLGRAQVFGR